MSAATQEAEQRGGENVSEDVHTAVKVSVGQKGTTVRSGRVTSGKHVRGRGRGISGQTHRGLSGTDTLVW